MPKLFRMEIEIKNTVVFSCSKRNDNNLILGYLLGEIFYFQTIFFLFFQINFSLVQPANQCFSFINSRSKKGELF